MILERIFFLQISLHFNTMVLQLIHETEPIKVNYQSKFICINLS